MSDIYLIKKETLNAIADAIRDKGHLYVSQAVSPENMPEAIGYVYATGYDYGYSEGYSNGETQLSQASNYYIAPYMAQNLTTSKVSYNGKSYCHFGNFCSNLTKCGDYTYDDFFTYSPDYSGDEYRIKVVNSSNISMDILVGATCKYYDVSQKKYVTETKNVTLTIPANSSNGTYTYSSGDFQGGDYDFTWTTTIKGVIFN